LGILSFCKNGFNSLSRILAIQIIKFVEVSLKGEEVGIQLPYLFSVCLVKVITILPTKTAE